MTHQFDYTIDNVFEFVEENQLLVRNLLTLTPTELELVNLDKFKTSTELEPMDLDKDVSLQTDLILDFAETNQSLIRRLMKVLSV